MLERVHAVKAELDWTIVGKCRDCGIEVRIPCGADEPSSLSLKATRLASCSACGEAADLEREREREREEERARARRLDASGLDRQYHGLTWESVRQDGRVIEAARRWAEEERPGGLCLFGTVGAGKSYLAAAAAWTRLQRWPVRWVSVANLMTTLEAAFDDDRRREAVHVLTGSGAIVLDDLDKVPPTDYGRSRVYSAVDTRVRAEAPMLVTMNSTFRELGDRFGEAIASRIAGYCRGNIFELSASPDRRLRSA